ncbi:uncharacterized protein ACO6RY_15401 [Pungitius sinensis]
MSVCLTLLLILPFHKSTYTNTHSHKLECVCPHTPSECASLGVRAWGVRGWGSGGGGGVRERYREEWEGVRGSREVIPTHFSLLHCLRVPSFPPFLEPSKESLSPAPQLQSSSVQLCDCMRVCVCVCV